MTVNSRFTDVTLVTLLKPQVRGYIRSFDFSKNIYLGYILYTPYGLSIRGSLCLGLPLP